MNCNYLIEHDNILVGNTAASDVVAIESHLLIGAAPSTLQVQHLAVVVVGKHIVVHDCLQRSRHTVRVCLDSQTSLVVPDQVVLNRNIPKQIKYPP